MLNYDLTGKQVILVLKTDLAEALRPVGISGSPVLGKVHSVEDHGLWLDNTEFPVCPRDAGPVSIQKGDMVCHAHIFIPSSGVVSIVAFPNQVKGLEQNPNLNRIGFVDVSQ